MPVSVSERVSTLNSKIENANNCQKDESFSCKARQIIILASLFSVPYYYNFINNYLFT